jgi:5-methyltetrahydropteroyltriglutamate--homocysteine methyltransferase
MTNVLLPTSLVGSYAQPDWLIDRKKLAGRFPPRVRARELWRVTPEFLEEAQDDATLLAIRDQEQAGLDIITDGEQRRESYSSRFATALEGVDIDNPGTALDRSGHPNPVPRVVGRSPRSQREEGGGIWYYSADLDMEGWPCPALFRYFSDTPKALYAQIKARSWTDKALLSEVVRRFED